MADPCESLIEMERIGEVGELNESNAFIFPLVSSRVRVEGVHPIAVRLL